MRALVIVSDIGQQTSPEFFERMKIPHIQRSHPLILRDTEPSLNLCLLCGGTRPAVADHGADPGSQQFHLSVLIGSSVIIVKNFRTAVLGDGRLHDGHKVHKGIVKEDICANNKAAGIIDECDHINTMLLYIWDFQPGTGTGITAPYFSDVRPFVMLHVLIVRRTFL